MGAASPIGAGEEGTTPQRRTICSVGCCIGPLFHMANQHVWQFQQTKGRYYHRGSGAAERQSRVERVLLVAFVLLLNISVIRTILW